MNVKRNFENNNQNGRGINGASTNVTEKDESAFDYFTYVTKVWAPTHSTRAIRVARPEEFKFRACQAVRLILDGPAGESSRSMSLASGPDRPYLEFAARRSESDFKKAYFALKPGDQVRIRGPLGRFILDTDRPAVMLAGGIGITPFRSMLQFIAESGSSQQVLLAYASRNPSEIAFKDEIEQLVESSPSVRVIHFVSDWDGVKNFPYRTGRIEHSFLKETLDKIPGAVYYLAGPVDFVRILISGLRLLGIPKGDLRAEAFRGYAFEDAVPMLDAP